MNENQRTVPNELLTVRSGGSEKEKEKEKESGHEKEDGIFASLSKIISDILNAFWEVVTVVAVVLIVFRSVIEPRCLFYPKRTEEYTMPKFKYKTTSSGAILFKYKSIFEYDDNEHENDVDNEPWEDGPEHAEHRNNTTNVLFLHGNGGNVNDVVPYIQKLIHSGYNVYALEYKGYGSTNNPWWFHPNLTSVTKDLATAWPLIPNPRQTIVMGLSMGGGVISSWLRNYFFTSSGQGIQHDQLPGQLVFVNSFSSLHKLVCDKSHPYLGILMSENWSNVYPTGSLRSWMKILIVAAREDPLIPVQHSISMHHYTFGSDLVIVPGNNHLLSPVDHYTEWSNKLLPPHISS